MCPFLLLFIILIICLLISQIGNRVTILMLSIATIVIVLLITFYPSSAKKTLNYILHLNPNIEDGKTNENFDSSYNAWNSAPMTYTNQGSNDLTGTSGRYYRYIRTGWGEKESSCKYTCDENSNCKGYVYESDYGWCHTFYDNYNTSLNPQPLRLNPSETTYCNIYGCDANVKN